MESLRPVFVCIIAVSLTSAIHSQLVDTKYEGYTKFIAAIILLLLLVSPLRQIADQFIGDSANIELVPIEASSAAPEDYFLSRVESELESTLKNELSGELGVTENDIYVKVTLDKSDKTRLCIGRIVVNIDGEVDADALSKRISEKYQTDDVSVNSGA